MVSNDFEPLSAIVSHGESEVLEWKSATATRSEPVQTFVARRIMMEAAFCLASDPMDELLDNWFPYSRSGN